MFNIHKDRKSHWCKREDCDLDAFEEEVEHATQPEDYPFACEIQQNVPIYDSEAVSADTRDELSQDALRSELVHALLAGPGIVAFRHAFPRPVVDRATACFNAMISEQRKQGVHSGDHFARPGANDRLWRAQQKLAERDPQTYAEYYANPVLALICESWLGPMYQVTSDLNVVNPGGEAQSAHRDYHLGFMSPEVAQRFPAHVHELSPVLTLQGAVAHCDMPIESGPTRYLLYSQCYKLGYLAVGQPELKDYFDEHYVQLPLDQGDAVFFNPALFHCAGANHSRDILRMANLLQISSAFGRAMGTLDRARMSRAIFPTLATMKRGGRDQDIARVVAATAEGYAFPTNLDRDQPIGGLAPETQAELLIRATHEQLSVDEFTAQLSAQDARHRVDD